MKKKIIQSLAVMSMAFLMLPACIKSDKMMTANALNRESAINALIQENSSLYINSLRVSNIPLQNATKVINNANMVTDYISEDEKPIEEVEEIKEEPVSEIEQPIEEIKEIKEPTPEIYLSEDDIRLIATVTMAEAEGESEYGKRLVIDTILNRMDSERFPNTASGVIYQKSQFSCMWDGRINVCYVKDDIYNLVVEEMIKRTDYNVVFFRTRHYHDCGNPMFKVGRHYFSSL